MSFLNVWGMLKTIDDKGGDNLQKIIGWNCSDVGLQQMNQVIM